MINLCKTHGFHIEFYVIVCTHPWWWWWVWNKKNTLMSQVTIGVASLLLFSSFQSVKKIACFWRRSFNLWVIYMHFFLFIFTENESYSWFQIRNFLCVLETFCVLPFLPFLMSEIKIVNRILCINRTIHRSAAIHIDTHTQP